MPLSDRQREIVWTKIRKLNEAKALQYLEEKGFKMSSATYWRERGKIESSVLDRIHAVAKAAVERHMDRIEELEKIKDEMWENYKDEEKPLFKVRILKEIKEMEPYLSAYDEAAKYVYEESVRKYGFQDDIQQGISSLEQQDIAAKKGGGPGPQTAQHAIPTGPGRASSIAQEPGRMGALLQTKHQGDKEPSETQANDSQGSNGPTPL